VEFEWDEGKRLSNFAKHRVDFRVARRIFAGPVSVRIDLRADYGEVRKVALGLVDGQVYNVVYRENDDVIRIISAWKGGRRDAARYQALFPRRP
jgi:uncharacterized protein